MAQNLKDFYKENQTEPVLTTVGRGMRPMTDALQERDRIKKTLPVIAGALANQAPKVLGVPAAGIANAASRGIADFQTGFTGQKYRPQQFEAKSFSDMFGGQKAMAAPIAATPPVAAPTAPVAKPAATSSYVPGTGLPSAAQVASDKSRALLAQAASDERLGLTAPAAPTTIDVKRQPNGILSFTGSGDGAGVKYSGMPNWTSQRGGAGQGAVGQGFNLGEQNQRMAAALQGIQAMDQQKKADSMIDAMASGAGGPIGVAQNKLAMGALGPLLERQMANESAMGINRVNAETQRRGQDLGLTGELARASASRYGTEVGAKNAAQQLALGKQELDLKAAIAKDGKSGDPEKVAKARLAEVEYMRQTGLTLDGKRLDPGYHQELLKNKMLTGSQPYAAGLVGEEQ